VPLNNKHINVLVVSAVRLGSGLYRRCSRHRGQWLVCERCRCSCRTARRIHHGGRSSGTRRVGTMSHRAEAIGSGAHRAVVSLSSSPAATTATSAVDRREPSDVKPGRIDVLSTTCRSRRWFDDVTATLLTVEFLFATPFGSSVGEPHLSKRIESKRTIKVSRSAGRDRSE